MSYEQHNLIRVMGLHSITYCERLYYLEEVEKIHVADAAIYAGRTLHETINQEEEDKGSEWINLTITSENIGLIGKVDCLRRRDGLYIPYEHKRGRPRRENKKAEAWFADALQVSAYGMLLEEYTGERIPEGRVHYHAENVTIRIPLNEIMRASVRNTIERARQLSQSINRPPVTKNDRLCIKCSLAPVCLPEEERFSEDNEWEPLRLFPEDREAKVIHVMDHGAKISRSGEALLIYTSKDGNKVYPSSEISAIILHGYPQITTQALHFCARNSIGIHWLSAGGYYVGGLTAGAGGVQRKLRQYKALSSREFCIEMAKKLAHAKVEGSLRYILRATRGMDRDKDGVSENIDIMRKSLKGIAHSEDTDNIRGYEGTAGKSYFSILPFLLRDELPEELRFTGRNRRPPKDRINAILSFGYSLVYQAVMQSILSVGLEPSIGFFHTPRSSAYPLVMDLMELFRLTLWDMVVIGSLNRLQWNPVEDFSVTPEKVWLSDSGKKKAITLFENRLEETWKHPVTGYSLSYSRLVELEVRLLEKEWGGQPGLFAKMRLR